VKTGIDIGNRRNGRSRTLPSEYMTMLETKEPANERSTTPNISISRSSASLADWTFRNTTESGIIIARMMRRRIIE